MKKITVLLVVFLVSFSSVYAQQKVCAKLIASEGFQIAIGDTAPKTKPPYVIAVANYGGSWDVETSTPKAFVVEYSVAQKINKLTVPAGKRLVFYVYDDHGTPVLGSYGFEDIPVKNSPAFGKPKSRD